MCSSEAISTNKSSFTVNAFWEDIKILMEKEILLVQKVTTQIHFLKRISSEGNDFILEYIFYNFLSLYKFY